MKRFSITEKSYATYRKKWLRIMIPVVAVISILLITGIFVAGRSADDNWLYFAGIAPMIYGISIYRSLKKQKRFMYSYSITITDNEITREQMNTPPLTISFMEIKEIVKYKKGNFAIRGAGGAGVILVPYLIDDPAGLEQELQLLAPITVSKKDQWYVQYRVPLVVLVMGAFISFFVFDNKIVTLIVGTALVGLIIWIIYFMFTSKNVPATAKRYSLVYILFIAYIIYIMYTRITGNLLFI